MDTETFEKANKLHNQISDLKSEIDLVKNGTFEARTSHAEGTRWQTIKGIDEDAIRDAVLTELEDQLENLEAEFEAL